MIYISLIITAIYVCFSQGMILSFVRVAVANLLDKRIGKKWSLYVQKPLWGCLPCMASIWTVVIAWRFDIWLMLAVCGLNVIISRIIERDETVELEVKGTERVTEYHDEVPTISRQKLMHG